MSAAQDILKNALRNTLGQQALNQIEARSTPAAYYDLWMNNNRRDGINPRTGKPFEDSHIQGKVTLPLPRLKQLIAEAEVKGHKNLQIYMDLWFQHDGSGKGPMLTGKAVNVVPDAKRFEPKPQQAAAADATAAAGLADPTEPKPDAPQVDAQEDASTQS